jgi:DNA-binding transcriptional MocR family regulator
MTATLSKNCSSLIKWDEPRGGYYVWCKLMKNLSSRKLLNELYNKKIAAMIGEPFFLEGDGAEWIRLNFTFENEKHIEEGIKILCRSLKKLRNKRDAKVHKEETSASSIVL